MKVRKLNVGKTLKRREIESAREKVEIEWENSKLHSTHSHQTMMTLKSLHESYEVRRMKRVRQCEQYFSLSTPHVFDMLNFWVFMCVKSSVFPSGDEAMARGRGKYLVRSTWTGMEICGVLESEHVVGILLWYHDNPISGGAEIEFKLKVFIFRRNLSSWWSFVVFCRVRNSCRDGERVERSWENFPKVSGARIIFSISQGWMCLLYGDEGGQEQEMKLENGNIFDIRKLKMFLMLSAVGDAFIVLMKI